MLPNAVQEPHDACIIPTNVTVTTLNTTHLVDEPTEQCHEWVYSDEVFTSTIVSEWDLVCEKKVLTDVTQTTFMLGVLLGNVVIGSLADRWGRKTPLMWSIVIQALASGAAALAPWFILFVVCRFFLAVATGGILVVSFVLAMETSGDRYRTTVSILYQIPFSLGICILAGVAYFFRAWRHFHLALTAMSSLFFLYVWWVPESPRWLIAVGQEKEAVTILTKAARVNGRDGNSVTEIVAEHTLTSKQQKTSTSKHGLLTLLRNPSLRFKSLGLFLNWFIAGLSFFALSQSLGRFGGDIFINIAIAGLIGVPGTIGCVFAVQMGRKRSIMASQVVAGISCLLIIAFPAGSFVHDWPRMCLCAVAITAMSIYFPALYLFSGELLPTVVRNAGMGASSMFSRLGSAIAPFVKSLDSHGDLWPMLIIGIMPLVGAVVMCFLPETKGQPLPDTIEDEQSQTTKRAESIQVNNYLKVDQEEPKLIADELEDVIGENNESTIPSVH